MSHIYFKTDYLTMLLSVTEIHFLQETFISYFKARILQIYVPILSAKASQNRMSD